ncbi:nuclear receptor-binding factor 2 [Tribolium castaneum]|uniref:Nuclear receptor-binding factor 2-like Protein n=1 Tax=Tribolium castaneum TaxID=7070 RepID=D6WB19_TRICA|nr:PREDICTED: nuclear receptor-binding factor 2 [Tribolium castaneum]EEZ98980.2 Nuclear receptor-binding factor 2-like Protein [Tribolium castaneum]|eukprot:XP_008200845.1 PREDICTED: nuclear receptor-binding factor 2 [Tribolium castaneum]
MENSPLNKAHQLDRRAEALLKQKKFDESIECHQNAMKYLHDALNLTQNPRSLESIQLQIDHHQKQVDSLKIKKLQYEDLRRYQESVKNRVVNFDSICENGETLQHEIFRTIETHDSLIEVMMKRNCGEECLRDFSSDDEKVSSDTMKVSGKKREVDDSTLLEEFKGLSEKLREFVQILVLQLEEKDNEIARLKAEIYKLECEKNKDGTKNSNTLRVITDSSGGTSPYVFSPCSELSPEVHDIRGLPPLAPLEMPNFDFSSLVKNANNLNLNGTNN